MVNSTVSAPEIIQEQVTGLLVQPLEAASVVLSSGVRIFDSSEPLRIPTLTAGINAGFVAENGLIPDDDVEFGEIKLMPSDRKSIKALTKFSNELLRQSMVGLDAVLKSRLVTDVSNALDDALLKGIGADKSITGIINQEGVQNAALDVSDTDSLLDALAQAAAEEVTPNRWFLSGTDFFALRKLKDANGRYIVESDVTAGARYSLFGIPVTVTNKLAAGKAVLADTSQIAVVRDLAPSVTLLSERYAEYDQQAIRVVTRYDLGLLHPQGVVVLSAA
ncbi:phage major capsid protein [Rhodococcus sp. 06-156-3b]|nr:phage major capsid protein [Rhodococcus sp. 06-156-3b]OZD31695.1 phage major capsid protein [Rhodococcus sp. 06-156-3b]